MPHDMTLLDAALHVFPNVFLFDGGRYVVATLLMSAVLFIAHRAGLKERIIQARRASRTDYMRELLTSLRTVVVYAIIFTPVLWLKAHGFGAGRWTGPDNWMVTAAFVVALLVVHDAYFYWTHRLIHRPAFFKRWHRTHHKTITPTPFTAYAFDWREAALHTGMPVVWQLTIPTPNGAFFIFLGIMIIRNAWGHCGTELHPRGFADHWFWGNFTTTTHHDLHHSGGFGSNYGLYFTWWDRICGTEHPRYREIFREITLRGSMDKTRDDVPVAA
jgi:sterol desaturase/sphingolipid hydroxylase (fatty acid hydroxylase superfamily)